MSITLAREESKEITMLEPASLSDHFEKNLSYIDIIRIAHCSFHGIAIALSKLSTHL